MILASPVSAAIATAIVILAPADMFAAGDGPSVKEEESYTPVWTAEIPGERNSTHVIALTGDGKFLAVSAVSGTSPNQSSVHVFNVQEKAEIASVQCLCTIREMTFNSQGTELLVKGVSNTGHTHHLVQYGFRNGRLLPPRSQNFATAVPATYVGNQLQILDFSSGRGLPLGFRGTVLRMLPPWDYYIAGTDQHLAIADLDRGDALRFGLSTGQLVDVKLPTSSKLAGRGLRISSDGAYLASFTAKSAEIGVAVLEGPNAGQTSVVDLSATTGFPAKTVADLEFLAGTTLVYSNGQQLVVVDWKNQKTVQVLIPAANGTLGSCSASTDGTYFAVAFEAMGIYPKPHGHNIHLFQKKKEAEVAGTPPADASLPPEDAQLKVLAVEDGDTISVEYDGRVEHVRLLGIDSAELGSAKGDFAEKDMKEYGRDRLEAGIAQKQKEYLEALLKSSRVTLRYSAIGPKRDDTVNKRVLAYVWSGEIDVNAEIARNGYTYDFQFDWRDPQRKLAHDRLEEFSKLVAAAKQAKRGVWGMPE